jgi:hypothetical protein
VLESLKVVEGEKSIVASFGVLVLKVASETLSFVQPPLPSTQVTF